MDRSSLPNLLFFEQIPSGDFVTIDLKNKSAKEIISLSRDLFSFLYKQEDISLNSLRKYKLAKSLRINVEKLVRGLVHFGEVALIEYIKTFNSH